MSWSSLHVSDFVSSQLDNFYNEEHVARLSDKSNNTFSTSTTTSKEHHPFQPSVINRSGFTYEDVAIINAIAFITDFGTLISSTCLLISAIKKISLLILPWIIFCCSNIILDLIANFYLFTLETTVFEPGTAFILIVNIFNIIVQIYFLCGMTSLYRNGYACHQQQQQFPLSTQNDAPNRVTVHNRKNFDLPNSRENVQNYELEMQLLNGDSESHQGWNMLKQQDQSDVEPNKLRRNKDIHYYMKVTPLSNVDEVASSQERGSSGGDSQINTRRHSAASSRKYSQTSNHKPLSRENNHLDENNRVHTSSV